MSDNRGLLPVTQADRDAAADYFETIGDHARATAARCGNYDLSAAVRAFTKHSLAAAPLAAPGGEVERLKARIIELEAGLRPFADLIAGSKTTAPRYFVQLLICPEGDNDPQDWRGHLATAAALLANEAPEVKL